jgi:hypothetical protein
MQKTQRPDDIPLRPKQTLREEMPFPRIATRILLLRAAPQANQAGDGFQQKNA